MEENKPYLIEDGLCALDLEMCHNKGCKECYKYIEYKADIKEEIALL